jgi:eukaryotic-like serine/threonine-protein kinase
VNVSLDHEDALALSLMTIGALRRSQGVRGPETMAESGHELDTAGDSRHSDELVDRLSRMTTAKLAGREHEPVIVGDYEVERLVGKGGMGQVFAARSQVSGRHVALKILHRSSARALLHLKREFRVLADVEHPNLVEFDELVVLADDQAFFTMELVAGRPFVAYARGRTRRGRPPNAVRLRRVLTQLVAALEHLHANGFVHRDLKPSNVLVTDEGRVVVLDFGLVDQVTNAGEITDDHVLGTPAYMAPEQAAHEPAGPPADLYAVGVMLYECLCGVRPFVGNPNAVLIAKLEQPAPDPASLVPEADPELLALCRELLRSEPDERPSATELLERLHRTPRAAAPALASFVGRSRELASLDAALAELHTHNQPSITLVRGPPGQGKSRLLSRWLAGLDPNALVLKGRCLERESVPYKGLDAAIDALSSDLRRLPDATLDALRPPHVAELARLFPVLGGIWTELETSPEGLAPVERRERAVSSLRELLARLSRMHTIVLALDDFHWADLDSALILEQLVTEIGSPALALIVAFREPPEPGPAVARLQSLEPSPRLARRELELGPLSPIAARELVAPLLRDEPELLARTDVVVRQAAGNPSHLLDLAHARSEDDASLERLIARRILELDPAQRRLLALVALAGPIERSALELAGCVEADVDALVAEGLLDIPTYEDWVEVARESIARFAIGEIDAEELPRYHVELARALAGVGASPELLAEHFMLGGQRERAFLHADQAASLAMDAMAFRRAADWLERCIAWLPSGDDVDEQRRQLERRLVAAYVNTGRLVDGARILLNHAEAAEVAEAAEATQLRIQAVEYLLKAGRMQDGLREAAVVLAAHGLALPRRVTLFANLLGYRRRLARDLARLEREMVPREDPVIRARARVYGALTAGFLGHEALLTIYFLARWRHLALELGDRLACARAFAIDSVICTAMGQVELARALVERARDLADGDANLACWFDATDVHTDANLDNWRGALTTFDAALPRLEARPEAQWERRFASEGALWALAEAGRYRHAIALGRRRVQLGVELNDLKQIGDASAFVVWALACVGELDEADHVLAEVESRCGDSDESRYLFRDLFGDFARIRRRLRGRQPHEAAAIARRLSANMKIDGLWHVAAFRHAALALIACAELQLWLRSPSFRLRRRLKKISRQLSRASPHQRGNAAMIEATLSEVAGDTERANALLSEAAECFARSGAEASLAAVQIRRAQLVGGDEAERLRAEAEEYFRREAIRDPEDLVMVLAPGPHQRPASVIPP